jgi:aspartate racemase
MGSSHHIGILAHSADGAALCFTEMCRHSAEHLGVHQHPEITLSILPMGPVLEAYERGDLASVNASLMQTAERLKAAGCSFFVCPDNTAHIALEAARAPYSLPGLHIAEIVAREAQAHGYDHVGLLGTKWTMAGPVYPGAFARAGVEMRVPTADDGARVDRIIFDELCQGVVSAPARAELARVIGALKVMGCDAVALCCTELPLLVTPESSPLPTLDSTRLLAAAAVHVALGLEPFPIWRGGPLSEPHARVQTQA